MCIYGDRLLQYRDGKVLWTKHILNVEMQQCRIGHQMRKEAFAEGKKKGEQGHNFASAHLQLRKCCHGQIISLQAPLVWLLSGLVARAQVNNVCVHWIRCHEYASPALVSAAQPRIKVRLRPGPSSNQTCGRHVSPCSSAFELDRKVLAGQSC